MSWERESAPGNELKLLASLAQAGTEGRDFRDVEGGEYLGVSW